MGDGAFVCTFVGNYILGAVRIFIAIHLALLALADALGASICAKTVPDSTAALHLNIQVTSRIPLENHVETRCLAVVVISDFLQYQLSFRQFVIGLQPARLLQNVVGRTIVLN